MRRGNILGLTCVNTGMAMALGKAAINVTPLIDVLLVLIIIFMVVLPQHSVGLPTAVPQPAATEAPPS